MQHLSREKFSLRLLYDLGLSSEYGSMLPQEILKIEPLRWAEIAFRVLYEIRSGHQSLKKHLLKRGKSLPELLKSAEPTERG